MRIDDDHLYHGAALIQIAEDPHFTAINSFMLGDRVLRSAYRVNDDVGVFVKYATTPNPSHGEYVFTFRAEHLTQLRAMNKLTEKLFLALVCVQARHVCCLPFSAFLQMIVARYQSKGDVESQYILLVTMPEGKGFRAYVNAPGVRNKMLGRPAIISRNSFPSAIFE